MISPQAQPRKKLLPKRPSKVLNKCKTFVVYSPRDYGLTNNQQQWARSLAISLSGWRARQNFLRAQLEAHLKDDANREVQEVSRKAQRDTCQGNLAKRQTKMPKQRTRCVADYQQRSTKAYQGYVEGVIGERLFEEENERCYVFELQEPASSAEEELGFENRDGSAYESMSGGIPDAEYPSNRSALISRSTSNLQLPSNVPAVAPVDWRLKAHNSITKKKLSMGKRWSAVTWSQKSNVQERLLLLEYDGFDITRLQSHRVSSEEITAIILERIAAQQKPKTVIPPAQESERPNVSSEESQDSLPVLRRPKISTSKSPSALVSEIPSKNPRSLKVQLSARFFSAPSHQSVMVSKPQFATTPIIEDDTAPFTLHESYRPQPSPRLKRKRDFEDPDELIAASHPALKKRKIKSFTKDEHQPNALQEIKRKVLRRIFRPARSVCQRSSIPSRVIFSKNKIHANQQGSRSISTLDYLYTRQPVATTVEEPLVISRQGYDNMMKEIKFLTNTSTEIDDGLFMYNPDYGQVLGHGEDCIEKGMENFFRQKSCITISRDDKGHQVFEGDTLTLAELFKVLRERELLHRVDWKWEGIHLSPSSSLLWSLSPETQNTLAEVERRLRRCARTGGVEIGVGRG